MTLTIDPVQSQPLKLNTLDVVNQNSFVNITADREFLLGGLFPVFKLKGGALCGEEINEIQHLEAMIWSVNKVNEDEHILKKTGIKLGMVAYDTCYSDTIALQRALNFIPKRYLIETQSWQCDDGKEPTYTLTGKMLGVVGASTSAVSKQVASFLRLFQLPQVSYMATSPELSDMARYDYFMRTVSSDKYQAQAMIGLLRSLNWTFVTAIYEDTSYGQYGMDSIYEAAAPHVCIGHQVMVKRYFANEDEKKDELKSALKELEKFTNTKGSLLHV